MARKTIRARRLGQQIRKLRAAARLSQDDLVELVNSSDRDGATLSQGQLSRIEVGSARLTERQLERIVDVLNANASTALKLESLRARAEEAVWWNEYSDSIPEALEMLIEVGEDAVTMQTYDSTLVQGLVQTEEYGRIIIESGRAFVRPTEVDLLVELRMRRQERLTQEGFNGLTAVLGESALHHIVGNRAVMRRQLEKLCEVMEEGIAAVHVLPYEAGPWPAVGGFVIFSFADENEPDVGHVDGEIEPGGIIYEDRSAVKALTYTHNAALAQALSLRESRDLIHAVMKEL